MIFQIEKLLKEEISPLLSLHQGAIKLIDVDNNRVFVRFEGGCQGCSSASQTLKGLVSRKIKEKFPEIEEIIDLTSHEKGEKPYYK